MKLDYLEENRGGNKQDSADTKGRTDSRNL